MGVEPTTSTMATWRSTAELHPHQVLGVGRQASDVARLLTPDTCRLTPVLRPGAHMKNPSRPRLGGVLHAPHRDDVRKQNSSTRAYPPARRDLRRASGNRGWCSAFSRHVLRRARRVAHDLGECTRIFRGAFQISFGGCSGASGGCASPRPCSTSAAHALSASSAKRKRVRSPSEMAPCLASASKLMISRQ